MAGFSPAGLGGALLVPPSQPKLIRGDMSPRLKALAEPRSLMSTPRSPPFPPPHSPRTPRLGALTQSRGTTAPAPQLRTGLADVVDWRDVLVRGPERRPDLASMPFNPTGSPRIVQSGSVAYDRWRLKRDRERDVSLQMPKPLLGSTECPP